MSEPRGVRAALGWAFVMTWGRRGLAIIFTIVIAALVGPRAYGIVAIALVYVQLLTVFLEQGLGTAIIQRRDLRHEHLDAAFWLNLVWGILLVGVGVGTAPLWAEATGIPELTRVIQVLSIGIFLIALTVVQQAVLERALDFRRLAIRSTVAGLLSGICGVVLAAVGAGVWALVGQQLALELVSAVLLWRLGSYVPRLRFSWRHARDLLGFAVDVFFANLGGFLGRRSDTLLIGVFFGPVVVGVYRLADRLVDTLLDLTMRPVAAVSLPEFSRLQDEAPALQRRVARFLHLSLLLTIPAMLVVAACSEQLLAVVGSEWTQGADALKLLAVVGAGKAVAFFTGPLLFALARARLRAIMLWSIAALSATTVVLAGLAFEGSSTASQLVGVSGTRAVLYLVVIVPVNLFIVRALAGVTFREMLPWFPVPIGAGALAFAATYGLEATGALDHMPALPALLAAGSLAVLVAGGTLLAFERDLREGLSAMLRRVRQSTRFGRRSDVGARDR